MRLFLGWSGDTSLQLAETFRDWLRGVLQTIDPFLSSRDIASGEQWAQFLTTTLADCDFGIFFLTRANHENAWMHFEAGSMLKKVDKSRICPLLFNLAPNDIKGPFSMFHATRFIREDIWKLVATLNQKSNGTHYVVAVDVLQKSFDDSWPKLEHQLEEIRHGEDLEREALLGRRQREVGDLRELAAQLLGHETIHSLGLREIYATRTDCLQEIHDEITAEAKEVIIVGSSLRGMIGVGGESGEGAELVRKAIMDALRRNVRVKMLLTHPKVAHHRSTQEGREQGQIEAEIIENLIYLTEKRRGNAVLSANLEVKLYNGTPTIFMVRTSRAMFFNPYPFYSRAFDSLCFLALSDTHLFRYYSKNHYEAAWGDGRLTEELAQSIPAAVTQLRGLIEGRTQHNQPVIPDPGSRQRLIGRLTELEDRSEQPRGVKPGESRESKAAAHSSQRKEAATKRPRVPRRTA